MWGWIWIAVLYVLGSVSSAGLVESAPRRMRFSGGVEGPPRATATVLTARLTVAVRCFPYLGTGL